MGQRIDLTQQVQGILPETNGGAGPNTGLRFSDSETPSGTINGVNQSFTLAFTPSPALSLLLFMNKTLQIQGTDYTLSGATISMVVAPPGGATFLGWYRYLTFGWAQKFQEAMSLSDAILVDAPVAKMPLGLLEQWNAWADSLAYSFSPTFFADQMVLSDLIAMIMDVRKPVTDTTTANWKEVVLRIMAPSQAQFGDAMVLSESVSIGWGVRDTMAMSDSMTHS